MAKKHAVFTIVTPSYNQADFLSETIDSIWSQKGDFYVEHIIADGGSSDGSAEIIEHYEKLLENDKYPIGCLGVSLKWWSRADNGQSDAINQGFKKSSGEFIAWLNSDDYYEPGVLAEALHAFKNSPEAGMVFGDYSEIDANGKNKKKIKVPDFSIDYEIDSGNMVPQPSVFMRKEALFDVGLLNTKYHYAMDYDLWIRIGLKYPVIHIGKYWSVFRLHQTSKTVSLEKNFWKEEREISRKYGAPFFSQHLINHYNKYNPRLGFFMMKGRNAYNLLSSGKVLVLIKRALQNIILLISGRKD